MHNQFWCGAGSGTAAQLRQVPGHPGRRGPDAALGSDTASASGASGDRGLGLLKLLPGCGQRVPMGTSGVVPGDRCRFHTISHTLTNAACCEQACPVDTAPAYTRACNSATIPLAPTLPLPRLTFRERVPRLAVAELGARPGWPGGPQSLLPASLCPEPAVAGPWSYPTSLSLPGSAKTGSRDGGETTVQPEAGRSSFLLCRPQRNEWKRPNHSGREARVLCVTKKALGCCFSFPPALRGCTSEMHSKKGVWAHCLWTAASSMFWMKTSQPLQAAPQAPKTSPSHKWDPFSHSQVSFRPSRLQCCC